MKHGYTIALRYCVVAQTPSEFSIILGFFPSMTETHELVVPKSISNDIVTSRLRQILWVYDALVLPVNEKVWGFKGGYGGGGNGGLS